ncbi:MAG: polyphosphate polymerase domain-containing protein [Clostridiales bacterium]|nr:polyphosphate polymerase domain-containing protein [Clostridiales bacterium]
MNSVLRQEKKYFITALDYMRMSGLLGSILKEDPHNGKTGFYRIRSLYFDTPFDDDYNDKIDGLELRRKIRLRIYDENSDFAMLEMKQKQGSMQLKRSIKLSWSDAQSLISGDYSPLKWYSDAFAAELYGLMRAKAYLPKAVVEYKRRAFIAPENKIRITLDSAIRATEANFDIFLNNLPMYPVFDDFNSVLEVKYNDFLLSYIKKLISVSDRSILSVSKYCLARSLSKQ